MRATVPLPGSQAYRTVPTCVATLLISALSAAAAYGKPAGAGAALPVLTQVSQIRQLTRQEAARGYPVRSTSAMWNQTEPREAVELDEVDTVRHHVRHIEDLSIGRRLDVLRHAAFLQMNRPDHFSSGHIDLD